MAELAEAVEEMKLILEGKKQAATLNISSMSYNAKTISVFERQTKRLVKKYPISHSSFYLQLLASF